MEPGCIAVGHGKPLCTFNQGLFIDIFPFDNVPDDSSECARFREELQKIKNKIWRIRYDRFELRHLTLSPGNLYHACWATMMRIVGKICGGDILAATVMKLEQTAQRYNCDRVREMAPVSANPYHREVLPSHFFDEAVEVPFEFMKIPVMAHHREALAINYGDWREHRIGLSEHGEMFIDTDRPYTDYLSD